MHSPSAILARSLMDSNPRIIGPYWNDHGTKIPPVTFPNFLLRHLELEKNSGQRIIDAHNRKEISYGDLGAAIRKSATVLAEETIGIGKYFLFIGPCSLDYLALYFGSMLNGSVTLQLPLENISLNDIQTFIIQHDIQYLVVDGLRFDQNRIRKLLKSVSSIKKIFFYNFSDNKPTTVIGSNEKIRILKPGFYESDDIAAKPSETLKLKNLHQIPCLGVNSSGTDSWPPKMALHNHFSLISTCLTVADGKILECRPGTDQMLAYGSFEHLENLFMFLAAIFNSCPLVLLPEYGHIQIIDAICRFKITFAILPANFIVALLKETNANLSILLKIIVFGGKITSSLCRKFFIRHSNVKSIRHCYMLAETPCPVTLMMRNSRHYDSVGYPFPGTKIKLIDLIERCSLIEPNRSGLILIGRDRYMFALGYLTHISSSMAKINYQLTMQQQLDGIWWLATKDIGYYDHEGLIYLHGQYHAGCGITSVVLRSQIESKLLNHPAISDGYVLPICGNRWAALVAPNLSPFLTENQISDIKQFLKDEDSFGSILDISIYTKIDGHLPKTDSGRHIGSLIAKEILNMVNIERKF